MMENASVPEVSLERTLAIVKPIAVKHLQDIIDVINSNGYEIIQKRMVTLTLEQASEFYERQEGLPSFPLLVTYMASGPVVALCLMGRDAVQGWRTLLGPDDPAEAHQYFPFSLRARFGSPDLEFENALHGSATAEEAVREIHFFFPEMIVEPLLTGSALQSYLAESVNPTLLEGLAELCKVKPVDPVVWLADWLLLNNPNKPTVDNPALLAVG
ncbi:nucleoside diphosphate kinase homolog 5-like isoform X2 [Bacillus rossius redtenbacheri]